MGRADPGRRVRHPRPSRATAVPGPGGRPPRTRRRLSDAALPDLRAGEGSGVTHVRETLLFLGQAVRHRRATGAVAPSGPALARAMAHAAGDVGEGEVLVELGPGTGVFTRELVWRFPQARVVAVEANGVFAGRLAGAVPGAAVVRGCASLLGDHLGGLGVAPERVAAVVSGLPILSLPGRLPRRGLAAA